MSATPYLDDLRSFVHHPTIALLSWHALVGCPSTCIDDDQPLSGQEDRLKRTYWTFAQTSTRPFSTDDHCAVQFIELPSQRKKSVWDVGIAETNAGVRSRSFSWRSPVISRHMQTQRMHEARLLWLAVVNRAICAQTRTCAYLPYWVSFSAAPPPSSLFRSLNVHTF